MTNFDQTKRKCIATLKSYPKQQLIRIVKTKQNQIYVDIAQNIAGRGAYICHDQKLVAKLQKNKLLHRAFKMDVPTAVYQQLIEIMEREND